MKTVSVLGTLPPLKGLSAYTLEFCRALSRRCFIDFIGFRRLYPESLYPGGTVDPSTTEALLPGVEQRHLLSWNNPISWVRAGWSLRGDVLHAQWWSYLLAPVFLTVMMMARKQGKRVVLTIHNVSPHEKRYSPGSDTHHSRLAVVSVTECTNGPDNRLFRAILSPTR